MKTFESFAVIGPGNAGWIVGWHSNQLVSMFPQWPRIRVDCGQRFYIAIDQKSPFYCDSDPKTIQVVAVIMTDDYPEKPSHIVMVAFQPFKYREGTP